MSTNVRFSIYVNGLLERCLLTMKELCTTLKRQYSFKCIHVPYNNMFNGIQKHEYV